MSVWELIIILQRQVNSTIVIVIRTQYEDSFSNLEDIYIYHIGLIEQPVVPAKDITKNHLTGMVEYNFDYTFPKSASSSLLTGYDSEKFQT